MRLASTDYDKRLLASMILLQAMFTLSLLHLTPERIGDGLMDLKFWFFVLSSVLFMAGFSAMMADKLNYAPHFDFSQEFIASIPFMAGPKEKPPRTQEKIEERIGFVSNRLMLYSINTDYATKLGIAALEWEYKIAGVTASLMPLSVMVCVAIITAVLDYYAIFYAFGSARLGFERVVFSTAFSLFPAAFFGCLVGGAIAGIMTYWRTIGRAARVYSSDGRDITHEYVFERIGAGPAHLKFKTFSNKSVKPAHRFAHAPKIVAKKKSAKKKMPARLINR